MLAKFTVFLYQFYRGWKRFILIAIASFYTFAFFPTPAFPDSPPLTHQAQNPAVTQATIVDIVGQQVLVRDRPANPLARARLGEQVRTTRARTQLNFNTGAVGRLGENTVLTIGQQCFQIQRGQILVKGAVNGCSTTVRAGVRGTSYWMEVKGRGQTEVGVLSGEVELIPLRQTDQAPVRLVQGQGIIIDRRGHFNTVRQWPFQRFESILQGKLFQGFEADFPGLVEVQEALEEVFPDHQFSEKVSATPVRSLPFPTQKVGFKVTAM